MRSYLISLLFLCLCGFSLHCQDRFPYPEVPNTLSSQEERINYLVIHFWDRVDFNDEQILETSKPILNYIYLLQNTDDELADKGLRVLFELAAPYEVFLNNLLDWFSKFLHDAHSPLYNDLFYAKVIKTAVDVNAPDSLKEILAARLRIIDQNQIGKTSNNIVLENKLGESFSLFDIKAQFILVGFTNPVCSLCGKTEKMMLDSVPLNSLLEAGNLKVLVVCPEDNYDEWLMHEYPDKWIAGYDSTGSISSKRLYDIQYFPSFYLLDSEKVVLMKEAGWKDVENALSLILRFN